MISNLLYDLVHAGDLAGVRSWLDKNPDDLNAWIGDRYAPLHVACIFGHEDLVTFLVGRGALINLNAMNSSRATPLHIAVSFRDEKVAARMSQFLIDNGAELNVPQAGGLTPLHHAVARGSEVLVNLLILAGADPFLKDQQGRSPSELAKSIDHGEASQRIREELKRSFSLT